jgi:hypothetical protein
MDKERQMLVHGGEEALLRNLTRPASTVTTLPATSFGSSDSTASTTIATCSSTLRVLHKLAVVLRPESLVVCHGLCVET